MRYLAVAILALSSTVWAAPPVTPATTTPPAAPPPPRQEAAPDPMAFARGARAWAATCSRCHGMRDPKEATDREWTVINTHMRIRAGLDAAQVRDITIFLQGSN